MPDYAAQRLNMVESQVRANDVTDVRIQEAMRSLPRERFVPASKQPLAYADTAVEVTPGRFLLDPRTFAKLAQLAEVAPGERLLDVGCASGYSSAVFAKLGAMVIALEEDAELVRIASDLLPSLGVRARVAQGKLSDGRPQEGPYDVIFVNGGAEVVPEALQHQLAENGRLLIVMHQGAQGRATVFVREHGRVAGHPDFDTAVPVLPGFRKEKAFVF